MYDQSRVLMIFVFFLGPPLYFSPPVYCTPRSYAMPYRPVTYPPRFVNADIALAPLSSTPIVLYAARRTLSCAHKLPVLSSCYSVFFFSSLSILLYLLSCCLAMKTVLSIYSIIFRVFIPFFLLRFAALFYFVFTR